MAGTAFARATPVLRVADYPRARAFWVDTLGFSVREEGGDPPRFGILGRGHAVVFLNAWVAPRPALPLPPGAAGRDWDVYFHVEDVDALAAECAAAGVMPVRGPERAVYGMRELEIRDPDGNLLCFGSDSDPT